MEGSSESNKNLGNDDELSVHLEAIMQSCKRRESAFQCEATELKQNLADQQRECETLNDLLKTNQAELAVAKEKKVAAEARAEKAEQELRNLSERLALTQDKAAKAEEELANYKKQVEQKLKAFKSNKNVELIGSSKKMQRKSDTETGGDEEVEEIPELLGFPEWLTATMPKRSPYFPQIGDELVYWPQGYAIYMAEVVRLNIYPVDLKRMNFSYGEILQPLQAVRVANIYFGLKPHRLIKLKLQKISWETRERLDSFFHIRYHHLPSVADFLVLRQVYEKYGQHHWQAGERFRCMVDKKWRLGSVLGRHESSSINASAFQRYSIQWEGGDDQQAEELSPWEMEVIPDDFDDAGEEVPATEEELRSSLYEVESEDWEPFGQEAECKRISGFLKAVIKHPIAKPFSTPVYITSRPNYAHRVVYPVDLSTIKARLDNLFYRRPCAILTDVERITKNTETLYQPQSEMVANAKGITMLVKEIVTKQDFQSVRRAFKRLIIRQKFKVEPTHVHRPSPSVTSYFRSHGSRVRFRKTVRVPSSSSSSECSDSPPASPPPAKKMRLSGR